MFVVWPGDVVLFSSGHKHRKFGPKGGVSDRYIILAAIIEDRHAK
jgi:hypothetical protein